MLTVHTHTTTQPLTFPTASRVEIYDTINLRVYGPEDRVIALISNFSYCTFDEMAYIGREIVDGATVPIHNNKQERLEKLNQSHLDTYHRDLLDKPVNHQESVQQEFESSLYKLHARELLDELCSRFSMEPILVGEDNFNTLRPLIADAVTTMHRFAVSDQLRLTVAIRVIASVFGLNATELEQAYARALELDGIAMPSDSDQEEEVPPIA